MDEQVKAAKLELQNLQEALEKVRAEAQKVTADADQRRRELAGARGDHITVRPPLCQGDFRAFTSSFKIYLQLSKITNEVDQKRSLMLAASTPKNVLKLQPYKADMESATVSYDDFEKKLISVFSPESEALIARREFTALRQQVEQNFTDYYAQKEALYLLAYPDGFTSLEASRFFCEETVKSLANVAVKRALFRRFHSLKPENLRESITEAIQSEDALVTYGLSEAGTRDGLQYSESFTRHQEACSGDREEPMDIGEARPGNCRACGGAGHWARDCRKKAPGPRKQAGPSSMGNTGKKKEARSCHRCHTPGHLRNDCRIPDNKLDQVRRKNKEAKGKQTGKGGGNRAVKQIETREEDSDEFILEALNSIQPDFPGRL